MLFEQNLETSSSESSRCNESFSDSKCFEAVPPPIVHSPCKVQSPKTVPVPAPITSKKHYQTVKAWAVNSHPGLRKHNEDRVMILTHLQKRLPKEKQNIGEVTYFAIFDGHGGSSCADFLRKHLHKFIIEDPLFPKDPRQAIANAFLAADTAFLSQLPDCSGSCAIVMVVVNSRCYLANLGDSRAISTFQLSIDHKPSLPSEHSRIVKAGGEVYKDKNLTDRVAPGGLAMTRSFGDPRAKLSSLGGKEGVIVSEPEVTEFEAEGFVLLGSDGVFDVLSNEDLVQEVLHASHGNEVSHENAGKTVNAILKKALKKKSSDNITALLVFF